MKSKFNLLVTALLLVIFSGMSFAGDKQFPNTRHSYSVIESNYLEGLKSDNLGLRESSAYYLGEIKSERAVIPLMRMLRESEEESSKIIAALSLMKIDHPMGVYLVKQQVKFNDSKRIRELCEKFYASYLHNKEDKENVKNIFSALFRQ